MVVPEDQGFCVRDLGLKQWKVHTTIQELGCLCQPGA